MENLRIVGAERMSIMGFVKISDDLASWAWINDPKTVYIYVLLRLGAAWCETDFRNIHLRRGQLAISQREFAKKCGVTYQELRTILNRLIATQKITQTTTHKISVITLLEYDCGTQTITQLSTTYQRNNNAIATQQQRDNNPPTLLYTDNQIIREQKPRAGGFNKVKQLFNSICVSLPPLENDLTITQAHLVEQARVDLRDSSFEEFFKRVEASDFLCGRTGGFRATFDWILKPENMFKILSGNYDRNFKQAQQAAPSQKSWSELTPEEAAAQAVHFYD